MPTQDLPDWTSAPVALYQARKTVQADITELGDAGTLFVNTTGRNLVVTAVTVVAFGAGLASIRDVVTGNVGWGGAPPATTFARWAISPESPMVSSPVDAASAVVPAGQDIAWAGTTVLGGGKTSVWIAVDYYLAS